jgi:hypothetical protein
MSWNQGHLLKSEQYEVVRLLGSGGFGMTYLAKDLNLARQVVIKRPNLSFEADRDYDKFLRRFKREGQVLAQMQIPNIVRVIEFTEIDGMPCLVMDFVAGETLNECIRRRGYIPEDEAVRLFQKLASAVEALHQQGIIHCDIHPGNIIVQPNSEPMLIDFGSTKLLHPTTWTVTTTVNKDFGPYDQMAESADNAIGSQPAWDIYSIAANMFFAVTGEKPMSAISRKLYGDSLKAPKELKLELSDRLNRMILQGMALEAKDRSSSVMAWINLLDVSPQAFSKDKTTINSSLPKKKTTASFPWLSMSLFVLGCFSHGVILGNYSGFAAIVGAVFSVCTLAFTGFWILTFAGFLAWFFTGCWIVVFAIFCYFALFGAGVSASFWSWLGAFIGAYAWFYNNDWIEDRQTIWLLITPLAGSLLGGGLSGYYLTHIGIIWGLIYGLSAWFGFVFIATGYYSSENRLTKNHSNIQVFWIYAAFSSISLISGGMLGSWLKVAGIIKLP